MEGLTGALGKSERRHQGMEGKIVRRESEELEGNVYRITIRMQEIQRKMTRDIPVGSGNIGFVLHCDFFRGMVI